MTSDAPGPLAPRHRATLMAFAEAMVPGRGRMPSAIAIGLHEEPIDRVLRARPDLTAPLVGLLQRFAGQDPAAVLYRLAAEEPVGLDVLMQVVAGAYYMDERVREALGYPGQEALTLERGGFGGEELLVQMMDAPPRYRGEAGGAQVSGA